MIQKSHVFIMGIKKQFEEILNFIIGNEMKYEKSDSHSEMEIKC